MPDTSILSGHTSHVTATKTRGRNAGTVFIHVPPSSTQLSLVQPEETYVRRSLENEGGSCACLPSLVLKPSPVGIAWHSLILKASFSFPPVSL